MLLCDKCYKIDSIELIHDNIVLDNKNIDIYTLFKTKPKLNIDYYIIEYSRLFKKIYIHNKIKNIIFLTNYYAFEKLLYDKKIDTIDELIVILDYLYY